jgi:hypothetical protein
MSSRGVGLLRSYRPKPSSTAAKRRVRFTMIHLSVERWKLLGHAVLGTSWYVVLVLPLPPILASLRVFPLLTRAPGCRRRIALPH